MASRLQIESPERPENTRHKELVCKSARFERFGPPPPQNGAVRPSLF
jgi:hypothetical protein